MIHASVDQIRKVIAGDAEMLRELHKFFDAVAGDLDVDVEAMLEELPAAIAAHSPFADEAVLTDIVRREMLQALRALALRMLPTKGTA